MSFRSPNSQTVDVASKHDLQLPDGRRPVAYDTGARDGLEAMTLLWHHGSPQTGALLEPLLTAADARNIRLVSYARPSYGGSSPKPGRDVAAAAADVAAIVDALGIGRFAVMGASGGGPHALACAALLPDRVIGAVTLASPAPYTEAFTGDWFAGMVAPGGLRAAAAGREARERYAATEKFDENSFTAADWAALSGTWASLGRDAGQAEAAGPDGLIDDDVAFASPWGFEVAEIAVPVLLVQGGEDRVVPPSHADWLMRATPTSELWLRPRDGHVSVLEACPVAMDWLLDRAK
jgi:pimeloyl-ACP methyl ester carboxylesterase